MNMEIDVSGVVLETERLLLRPWQKTDLNDLYAYASVEGVGEMAGWPHHTSLEGSAKILDGLIENRANFAIVHQETSRVIGSIGFHKSWASDLPRYRYEKMTEIGYALAKDAWGQGLMPEACAKVISWLFFVKDVDIITIGHFVHNARSERVINKLGFTYVETADKYAPQLQQTFKEKHYLMRRPLGRQAP